MLTMEEALKLNDKSFGVGQIVSGTVIEVRPKEVLVDIGYKSEGVIPASEFNNIEELKVSDKVDVEIQLELKKQDVEEAMQEVETAQRAAR